MSNEAEETKQLDSLGRFQKEFVGDPLNRAGNQYMYEGKPVRSALIGVAESTFEALAPHSVKQMAFDIATVGIGEIGKLRPLAKLAKLAGPLASKRPFEVLLNAPTARKIVQAGQTINKAIGNLVQARAIGQIQTAKEIVAATKILSKGAELMHATHVAVKNWETALQGGSPQPVRQGVPAGTMQGFKPQTTAKLASLSNPKPIKPTSLQHQKLSFSKLGSNLSRTPLHLSKSKLHLSTPRLLLNKPKVHSPTKHLQLNKPKLHIPIPHRPNFGNFHLRAPSILGARPSAFSQPNKRMQPAIVRPKPAFVPPRPVFKPAFRR